MDRMLNRAFYPTWTEGSLERENAALYLSHLEASYCGKKFPHMLGGKELCSSEQYISIDPNRPTFTVASFPRVDVTNEQEQKRLDKGIARVVLAQERFRNVPYKKRIELCEAFADRLEDQMWLFIALLMLQGKPAANAFGEFREAPEFVRNNIALAKQLYTMASLDPIPQFMADANGYHFLPNGPIVDIEPFNFPIAIPTDKVSSALLTGNAIIMKASGHVPLAGYLLYRTIDAAFRDVGLENNGVVNFLSGQGKELALYLVTHPLINGYTFTGSLDAVQEIRRATLGGKKHGGMMQEIASETSGCNPFVVWNDADIDSAVSYAVASLRNNSGQTCSHLGHLVLHEDIESEFVKRFIQGIENTPYGDVKEMSKPKLNQCGAIISQESLARFIETVYGMQLDEVVDVVYRKTIPSECKGFDFQPTLMRLNPRIVKDANLLHEWRSTELFCMAASYTTVRTLPEAKKICEAGRFKLTGSFFTEDADTARYFIEEIRCAGQWYWNSGCTGALAGMAFGGDALSGSSGSGMGASTLPALARYTTLQNLAFRFPKNWGELEKGAFVHSLRDRANILLP
jgi:acyl-CoA reductase-like NAD-dependent aldehyde dehydrogenase